MFKTIEEDVWVVDAEWVPDPVTGRRLFGLSAETPDAEVVDRLYQLAGATEEDPRPFVKTALCRVVPISVVKRKATGHHPVKLDLKSIPAVESPTSSHDPTSRGRVSTTSLRTVTALST